MNKFIYFIIPISLILSCEKDEFSKGKGVLVSSFSDEWSITANFGEFQNTVYFGFDHYDDSIGLIYRIRISNILPVEDTVQLEFVTNIPGPDEKKPTASFSVMTDEDAIADSYKIDTMSLEKSYLILECITNRKITGSFRIFLRIAAGNHVPKYATFIPDSFSIDNARFTAEKF